VKIWRCKKCDWVRSAEPNGSIGIAHAHAEKHAAWNVKYSGNLISKLPGWLFPAADPEILDQYVEKIKITDFAVIDTGIGEGDSSE